MQREHHWWYSDRVRRDMGLVVYGHWGQPVLAFPTTGGDEWEYEHRLIDAIAGPIDAGRIKVFSVNTNHRDSFGNSGAHPAHRSYMQAMYDAYIVHEVVPFIRSHCRDGGISIWTLGPSLGAYHAMNTLLKHPAIFKRCYAFSGVYDMKVFMHGWYDDNLYFNNPVDYAANVDDRAVADLSSCEIRIVTGTGPWERPAESYRLSHVLSRRGIRHSLDDWGAAGGHDWPYWRNQAWEYLSRI